MVRGDPVVKEALTVGVVRDQAWTMKSSTICKCSGYFLVIMVSGDPVVKEALIRKISTICVVVIF